MIGVTQASTASEVALAEQAVVRLADLLQRNGVSYRELAQRVRTTPQAVAYAMSGASSLTLRTLARYAHALGYRVELRFVPLAKP